MDYEERLVKMVEVLTQMIADLNYGVFSTGILSNLTMNQFICLNALAELENPMVSELAKTMNLAKPTVTNTVNNLVADGFVDKVQSSEDKRVFFLKVTRKGHKIISAHDEIHRSLARELTKPLSPDEVGQLMYLLGKIVESIDPDGFQLPLL
ncbi:MAG: MarR family winged helix-turn-helix transcriptional regulator [Deltaproteobacteria bacterium]